MKQVPLTGLKPFCHPIEVRFRDLDGLGHINNAVYLTYVEQCRTKWLGRAGLMTEERLSNGFPLILARTEIDYLMQGGFEDALTVEGWIEAVGQKSFTMSYRIMAAGKGVIARAKAVLVWFDFQAQKSMPIPDDARALLSSCIMSEPKIS